MIWVCSGIAQDQAFIWHPSTDIGKMTRAACEAKVERWVVKLVVGVARRRRGKESPARAGADERGVTCMAAREGVVNSEVAVLAFVGCDDNGLVFGGSLHPLLHRAFAVCASVVAPTYVHVQTLQKKKMSSI